MAASELVNTATFTPRWAMAESMSVPLRVGTKYGDTIISSCWALSIKGVMWAITVLSGKALPKPLAGSSLNKVAGAQVSVMVFCSSCAAKSDSRRRFR